MTQKKRPEFRILVGKENDALFWYWRVEEKMPVTKNRFTFEWELRRGSQHAPTLRDAMIAAHEAYVDEVKKATGRSVH